MNNTSTFSLPTLTRYSFASKQRFRLENFWVLSFAIIIALLAFCVFQVLKQTTTSYLIGSYEKKITELSRENKEFQILLSQQNSLKDLKATAEHFKFEPIAKVHYIEILKGTVAKQ